MITVKTIEAPSVKLLDNENVKTGNKHIKFKIPKTEEKRIRETATYSTIIIVDGKYVSLTVTQHLGYQKPYRLNHKISPPKGVDLFEDLFYWKLEEYTNPALHHLAYKTIVESDYYYQSKLLYEIQWEAIEVKHENGVLTISSREKNHYIAVPPNESSEPRYDYLLDDLNYKYDCKPGEYKLGAIEIVVIKK